MKTSIPLFKVFMAPDAAERVRTTLESGYVGQGPRVDEFEAELQNKLALPRRPITVSTGTHALDLAWHMIGIGPGDSVISTPETCTATNTNLVTRGARITWADVDPDTGLIDPKDVARKVTSSTKAIVAVDWAGRVCNYPALKSFGVPVVEDAAHAFMAHGVGAADYTMWSFQAIKHMTTVDGGALQVPEDQDGRARLLRWYGLDRTKGESFRCAQNIQEAGYKYHMNDVAASIGLANIQHSESIVAKHRANAAFYGEAFRDLRSHVYAPPPDPGSSWWLYCLLADDQAGFIRYLAEHGIAASPVHARNDKHDAFSAASEPADLPGVTSFSTREVAIPVGWWVTEEDRQRIADAVCAWAKR